MSNSQLDSEGAAIDLLKYFWPSPYPKHLPPIQVSFSNGVPEGDNDKDHKFFVIPYTTFETAILAILDQEVKRLIGEDDIPYGNELYPMKKGAVERNELRVEQRRKAGLV